MKITKRQLRRIIREEKNRLLQEMSPADAGIAAAGGGTPADQGMAAAAADAASAASTKKIPVAKAKTKSIIQAGESIWFAISGLVDQAMDQSDPASWLELANDLRGLADDVEDSIPE